MSLHPGGSVVGGQTRGWWHQVTWVPAPLLRLLGDLLVSLSVKCEINSTCFSGLVKKHELTRETIPHRQRGGGPSV